MEAVTIRLTSELSATGKSAENIEDDEDTDDDKDDLTCNVTLATQQLSCLCVIILLNPDTQACVPTVTRP